MKRLYFFLAVMLLLTSARAKDKSYTASTPAGNIVRTFLGISLKDSVDFIRWVVVLKDTGYTLSCTYGISKPNTNGFIDTRKIHLSGKLRIQNHFFRFYNGTKVLNAVVLNAGLLHLVDASNRLLTGTAGWGYMLNDIHSTPTDQIYIKSESAPIKDSLDLQGRTPCGIAGFPAKADQCYKLKWHIILYYDPATKTPTTYRVPGTPWRKQGGKKGSWKINQGTDGRVNYELFDENGKAIIHLLKLDENVFMFTDAVGKLMVGNEDFSYMLYNKNGKPD